jgi:hypothetical protein
MGVPNSGAMLRALMDTKPIPVMAAEIYAARKTYREVPASDCAIKRGSFDSLNVLTRWGFSPCASHILCTEALLTPQTAAIARQLHCVACGGGLWVFVTISISLLRAKGLKLRPRGRSSYKALTPPSAKRLRQQQVVRATD